ncbi:uncharacterized protein [Penaeus vannamei]|uniref:uncharacterized protein n=1 Tax=Penaeus vannamei TaxID=6689 RepID=UPI000F679D97|nr:uncharacterized protein LOC113809992 [Penaeus vannamei]XP_027217501.1 uncharacterized protein LOC113810010 [Penaeus vannamei]
MYRLERLLIAIAVAGTVGAQCPDTFFEAGGGCFHVIDTGDTDITWEDARETCIGLSDSGWTVDLASLDSTAQLEAFAEAWATVGADYRPYGYMWVGFTRETGEWANLDGVPISLYSNVWREGHPHDMNMYVYIEDVTMTSGSESRGRFYASCTMTDALQRALCRAYPQK